jgi:transposase
MSARKVFRLISLRMGKHHGVADRVGVQTLFKEGYSQSMIAKRTGVAIGTVKRWCLEIKKDISAFSNGPRRHTHGNPYARREGLSILSMRDKQKIATFSGQHPRFSQRKLSCKLPSAMKIKASQSTLSRVLKIAGLLNRHRPNKPALTPAQKRARVVFAKANLDRDWTLVLSADEVEVSIDSGQNSHNDVYWTKAYAKIPPRPTHKFPVSRRYFVAVCIHGAMEPVEYHGHLDSEEYKKLLEKALARVNELFGGHEWVYLHDGAPYHTSNVTQEWLETAVPLFFTKTEWPGKRSLFLRTCFSLTVTLAFRQLT